jgi:pimeloyl-ACP methyl ester carboxylesterase
MRFARSDPGIQVAYEVLGPPSGEPLLLVMGLGQQMIAWPDDFCAELVGRGFMVVRFDNRDTGLSTHLRGAGAPSVPMLFLRPRAVAAYRLEDMAGDAVAVLDAIACPSAHVVGVSLGGMIAQTVAIRHPRRVRTLTSIMSTPSPRIGRPTLAAMLALRPQRVRHRDEAGQRMVEVFRTIGSPDYPLDEDWLRELGRRSYDRSHDPAVGLRQLAAIGASGDRRPGLARLQIPTLVLHGQADPLIPPVGGRATAAAVRDARLVIYPGMGHHLPRQLWPAMIDEISRLAATRPAPR